MTEYQKLYLDEARAGRLSPYPSLSAGNVTRTEVPGIAWFVSVGNLDEDTIDAVIRGEIEHFRALGQGFEWTVSSLDPPFLRTRLEAAGFLVGPREVTVCYPLDDSLPAPGHEVREVVDEDGLADFCRVASAVFKKDFSPSTQALRAEMHAGRRTHLAFVGYDSDGLGVSTGRLLMNPEGAIAGLYSGSTLDSHRHQGFYRSVVLARMRAAYLIGARLAIVDAMPTSLPHLLNMGFEPLFESYPCEWRP
ncbi:MAG TPA: hypothetical protein VK171_03625 [Fimbriimonas sp.]|nr:hypothetical protein [Fimbriimonas sp.]